MARNSSSIWGSSDADCSSGANSQNDAHHLNADAQGRGAPTQGREEEAIASGLHQPCACWFCASPLNQPPGLAVHPLWGRREQGQKRWLKDFRKGLKCEIRKTVAGMREAAVAMYALEREGQHASRVVEARILFQTKVAQHRFAAQRQHDLDYYGHVADFSKKTYGPLSPQEQQWNLELRQEEEELGEEPPTLPDYSVIWLFIEETERVERNENKAVSAQKGAAAGSSASAPAAKAPPPLFQSQPPAPARVTMYRDPHRRWTFAARPLMTPVAGDAGTPAAGGTSDNAPVGVSAGSDASTLLLPRSRPVRIRTIPLPLPDGKDVHDHIPFKPNMLDPANISSGGFILPPWTIDIPTLMPLLLSMPYWIHEKESKLLHDGPYVHMAWKAYNTIFLPYCFLCGRWASIDHFAGKTHSDSKAVYYAKHDVMYRIEEHAMAPLLTIDESAPLEADSWV